MSLDPGERACSEARCPRRRPGRGRGTFAEPAVLELGTPKSDGTAKFDPPADRGLEPETAQDVVVRATHAEGDDWYEVGVFLVPQLPNYDIRLRWVQALCDGDPGAGNAGDLVYYWQFGDEQVQLGAPQTLDNGDGVAFGAADHVYADEVGPQEVLPWECGDPDYDFEVAQAWGQDECGNFHWNTATSGAVLAGEIDQLPLCSTYGIGGLAADHRCAEFTTAYVGEQYPHFAVLVSFAQTN